MSKSGFEWCRPLAAVAAAALAITAPAQAQSPSLQEPSGNVVLPVKPADAHWVWIGDYQYGNYSRSVLYDADKGELLGMIDTGWEGARLNWAGSEIYNAAMYMSRGYRGERTDVVTTYDSRTLEVLREVKIPPKTIRGFQDLNHFTLTDDNRFMLIQLTSPGSSIGVVDLKANSYVGEIETAGCINAMPAGNRRFFALCGDGSALSVTLNEEGHEASRKRYPNFFNADADPLHESGIRDGSLWHFVSHLGEIRSVDTSGTEFRFLKPWTVAQPDGDRTWIPGQPMQTLALHHRRRHLYVMMHASDLKPKGGGTDYHRQPGTEVRVFDLKDQRLLKRIPLKNLTDAIAVSQDDKPLLYASSMYHLAFNIMDGTTGKELREIPFPSYPNIIQPVD